MIPSSLVWLSATLALAPVFTEVATPPMDDAAPSRSVSWGDYDGDGRVDLFVGTWGADRTLRQEPDGSFSNVTAGPLSENGSTHGGVWGDIDVTHGTLGDAGNSHCAVFADYDADGDLDLYLANHDTNNRLFRNDQTSGHHWLHVELQGVLSNRFGVGARVELTAGGVTQVREFRCGSGSGSQDSLAEEFGLGAATVVDSLRVLWPGGFEQVLYALPVDRTLTVVEGEASAREPAAPQWLGVWPNPARGSTVVNFALPARVESQVEVFDLRGRHVRTLHTGSLEAGAHRLRWNGRDDAGAEAAAGTYLFRVRSGATVATGRFVLLR